MASPHGAEQDYQRSIVRCQNVLRVLTGVILGAFGLIVAMTTWSTGGFVQVTAKGLYYVIILSAVASLGTWVYRLLMEKQAAQGTVGGMAHKGQEG
jgi:hypothetical protein